MSTVAAKQRITDTSTSRCFEKLKKKAMSCSTSQDIILTLEVPERYSGGESLKHKPIVSFPQEQLILQRNKVEVWRPDCGKVLNAPLLMLSYIAPIPTEHHGFSRIDQVKRER
jgi:hypothetical protein